MPTSGLLSRSTLLRALLLVAVAVGLLARPMALVACELADARAQAADASAAHDAIAGDGVAETHATPDSGQDCCANAGCGECCATAASLLPTPMRVSVSLPVPVRQLGLPDARVLPSAYPVSQRPPIQA